MLKRTAWIGICVFLNVGILSAELPPIFSLGHPFYAYVECHSAITGEPDDAAYFPPVGNSAKGIYLFMQTNALFYPNKIAAGDDYYAFEFPLPDRKMTAYVKFLKDGSYGIGYDKDGDINYAAPEGNWVQDAEAYKVFTDELLSQLHKRYKQHVTSTSSPDDRDYEIERKAYAREADDADWQNVVAKCDQVPDKDVQKFVENPSVPK